MSRANSRGWLVALLVLAQLGVLGAMAGKREYIRSYGEEVYLRTAPIDPRDPFRGDYVRLNYPFSAVHPRQTRGTVADHLEEKGYPVYAVLKATAGGLYGLDYLTDSEPDSGLFLKGRTHSHWRSWRGGSVNVRYGIEQYFVQQGEGRAIEKQRGGRDQVQVPMEVRVALGSDGTAVIKDFRWSPLGIQLELLRFNRRGPDGEPLQPDQPISPRVRLTLKNVSERPLTLVDPESPCALALEPVNWSAELYPPADRSCDAGPGPDLPSLRLAPGQSHTQELELGEPRWHVIESRQLREIGALKVPAMFRLVYRSPEGLEQAGWSGELPSRAFNAFGQID